MTDNQQITIITKKVPIEQIQNVAKELFGIMAKAVVDVEQEIIAVGGEFHADAEKILLENGSNQANLWGINLYPFTEKINDFIEYHSLINLRPNQDNRSMMVENSLLRENIKNTVFKLIKIDDQKISPDSKSRKI